MEIKKVDVLAIGAHPDDIELQASGTVVSLIKKGYKVGVIDLTEGELSSRGNTTLRQTEAEESAKVMGLHYRENLKLKDGNIEAESEEQILKVVNKIRILQPVFILTHYFNDRHPDHIAASKLVKKACYYSGLKKYKYAESEKEIYRPQKIFYFMDTYAFQPSFIYDISDVIEKKMEAISCFKTQFYNPEIKEPETFISRPDFLESIFSKSKYYGFLIGVKYGEPFFCEENINYDFNTLLK